MTPADAADDQEAARAARWKQRLEGAGRWVLSLGLSAALLGWLLRHADTTVVVDTVRRVPAWAWATAALGLLSSYAVRAWRLLGEWRHLCRTDFAECLRIVLLHNAAVLSLPLRGGEAGYVLMLRHRWGVRTADAVRSLVWLRWQDLVVLCTLAVCLVPPLSPAARLTLAIAFVTVSRVAQGLLQRYAGMSARRWGVAAPGAPAPANTRGWWASAVNWTLKTLSAAILIQAASGLDAAAALRAGLGGEWGGVLPLPVPAGMGSYEAAAWIFTVWPMPASLAPSMHQLAACALAAHVYFLAVAVLAAAVAYATEPSCRATCRPSSTP